MNHGSALQTGGGEDPAIKALGHIFEKAALVNYKQVFALLEGTCTGMKHSENARFIFNNCLHPVDLY